MAIEAMKGAGMSYAGSSSASDVKAESQAKVETASNAAASDDLMKKPFRSTRKRLTKTAKTETGMTVRQSRRSPRIPRSGKQLTRSIRRRTIPRQSSESMKQPTVSPSRSLTKTRRKS